MLDHDLLLNRTSPVGLFSTHDITNFLTVPITVRLGSFARHSSKLVSTEKVLIAREKVDENASVRYSPTVIHTAVRGG